MLARPVPTVTEAPVEPRLDARPIDANEVIAAIHTQMLSPLVNTVVPVHNLDGSIDDIAELQVYPLRPQLHTALLERKLISLLEGTVVIIELLHGIVG